MSQSTLTASQIKIATMIKRGYTILSCPDVPVPDTEVTYRCSPCGTEFVKKMKNVYLDVVCRKCTTWILHNLPLNNEVLDKFISAEGGAREDERWAPIVGGWVSTKGRVVNAIGSLLTLDGQQRYHVGGRNLHVTNLLTTAFASEVATHQSVQQLTEDERRTKKQRTAIIDHSRPLTLDNVMITTNKQIHAQGNPLARSSERFKEMVAMQDIEERKKAVPYRVVPELPYHIIFEDGVIYNSKPGPGGSRYLAFRENKPSSTLANYKTYYCFDSNLTADGSMKHFKVHRLVCYAFNPREGCQTLADYEDLQVNHKDGNTLNNRASNLEWVTQSENMSHAYAIGANNKVRSILQFSKQPDGTQGELIKEHISIAQASRDTNVPEFVIRDTARNKMIPKTFIWKYKNEEENEAWSKRFSSGMK